MANWDILKSRGNVEDRRSLGPMALGGGLSLTGVILIVALNYLNGGSLTDVAGQLLNVQTQSTQTSVNTAEFEGIDTYEAFASTVLGSNNDTWEQIFAANNRNYEEPRLVLFRGGTESTCGGATSEVGPHYCPADQTIYLDETFFDALKTRLGGDNGDVAQAYVIAHEVGHHVQHLLGTADNATDNASSIKLELQADCYAGVWANSIKNQNVFEPNEIEEALSAAAAVGDDRIQKASTGRVNPESWTHGSSEERVTWFNQGYNSGDAAACNTFE